MTRLRLPDRRMGETIEFIHDRVRFTGTVGRYSDGRIGELFLNAGKVDTLADTMARDGAIAASLAIQSGCALDELIAALTRTVDFTGATLPAGPMGVLLTRFRDPDRLIVALAERGAIIRLPGRARAIALPERGLVLSPDLSAELRRIYGRPEAIELAIRKAITLPRAAA